MLYKTTELAQDLDVQIQSVHTWVKAGAPHQRDGRGHMWINGVEFAKWVETVRQAKKSGGSRMEDDEAYCLSCRKPVKLRDPEATVNGKQILLSGVCPECGCRINRGGRNGKSQKLSESQGLSEPSA
jgi:hypothetical protein